MLRKLTFLAILGGAAVSSAVQAQQTIMVPIPAEPPVRQVFVYSGGSYLGVQPQEVTRENYAKFGLREVRGAAIEKVMENSPAARDGLQDGDVILKFNGEEIASVRKLTRLIAETAPDHQVVLTIFRGGEEREITATLGKSKVPEIQDGPLGQAFPVPNIQVLPRTSERPLILTPGVRGSVSSTSTGNVFVVPNNSRQIGISTTPLTRQLAGYFGAADGGVLISRVRENSPAEKAGLKAGDVIVEIDGKKAADTSDLVRAFGEKTEGDVTITIVRDKSRQTVRVTPEEGRNGNVEIERFFENGQPSRIQVNPLPADAQPLPRSQTVRGTRVL